MRRVDASVASACLACVIMLFVRGGAAWAVADEAPQLTVEQAVAAARRNAKPGSAFAILRKIKANADTRRIGGAALEQAKAQRIELYEKGILVHLLRSGGYLLAEGDPQTNDLVALHLVVMEAGGAVKDVQAECRGGVKVADAEELVKETAELVQQVYSTPSTEVRSLASRFVGGNFPEAEQFPDSLFAIPHSLRVQGAAQDEVREAAALFWGYVLWAPRYALSMPAFAANPAAAGDAAEKKRDALKAEFLRSNHMDPNSDPVDLGTLQNEGQLRERIALLTRLDRFLEECLRKEADPAVVRTNLSMLAMPMRVDADAKQAGQFVSASLPKSLFLWHRVSTGGFAVQEITWDW